MKIFTDAVPAKRPKTRESVTIAYGYAFILIVLVLCQLFTFDKFLTLLESFWLPGGAPIAHLVGGVIVTSEVFALPFLLRLDLSPLMRVISMVLGWFVPLMWLKLALWLLLTTNTVSNFGLLGTLVVLTPGLWMVFISIAIGMLAAWASWGLWPSSKKHK